MGSCLMSVITYWQDELKLAGDIGLCGEAISLPQDEATAAVVIAAILDRNFGTGYWSGCYRARIEGPDGVAVVMEDDARVRLARVLLANRDRSELTASTLAAARGGVLASVLGEQVNRLSPEGTGRRFGRGAVPHDGAPSVVEPGAL